ncbi:MAG: phosphate ABC transporter permease subunit PstC [Planctomycetes bacterium]|nr:phosphate ABC transporter permease subunit PstC [Planctomycetota bacterium]
MTPEVLRRAARGERLRSRAHQRTGEGVVTVLVACAGVFSVLITAAIVAVLAGQTWTFFRRPEATLAKFFFATEWYPHYGDFGIWPLVAGTMLVAAVAIAVALPLGLITAIYLSEYAPRRVRAVIKPTLEVLAGIPTVVYGLFAVTVITPGLQRLHEDFQSYNAMAAGLAVGVLCLPIVSSLCEDALRAVPRGLRDGALGLGATKFDVSLKVVVPAAFSGIVSATLLAISRAVGETMIVALAAGNLPRLTADVRQQTQTMTGYMAQVVGGDVSNFGVEYYSLYAVAAMLFLITFTLTAIGQGIRKRYREVYK